MNPLFLPAGELRELSERIRTPLARLHEVASYFPQFRLTPPPAAEVKVCRDMACYLRGSQACKQRLTALASEIGASQVEVEGASCLGRCDGAPAVSINDVVYYDKPLSELEALTPSRRRAAAPAVAACEHAAGLENRSIQWQTDLRLRAQVRRGVES
jgi:NADH:ubiquinone oxidoreductase subunit E